MAIFCYIKIEQN